MIQKKQQKYYEAINLSNTAGESTPFITFILEIIKETLEELQKNDLKMTDILTDKELQRLKILEEYFEKNNYIDNSEVQKILNVSDSTARRFLNKLLKNRILEAFGEKKGRKYRRK